MNVLLEKFKDVLFGVLPITLIVLILNFTVAPLDTVMLLRFFIGAFFIIIGLSIFLFGVDIGVTPIGVLMGNILAKSNKILILCFSSLFLGFFISVAEPDLHILDNQVALVTSGIVPRFSIVIVVSLGVAVLITLGLFRILYNKSLKIMFAVIYLIIFVLSIFSSKEFIAIAFDASGATTGAMTVPFILALALGVSSLKKDGLSSENDSFGLVGIASSGAIFAVIIMSIMTKHGEISGSLSYEISETSSVIMPFIYKLPRISLEILIAMLPLLVLILISRLFKHKITKKAFVKILKGLLYTFIGLALFMAGVNAGFMDVGSLVGHGVASFENKWLVILIGFVIGLVVILAEPAVYVLTKQIEEVTSGYIKRKLVLFALSIGMGFAVSLSMVRILVPGIQLWHYLLPGFGLSIVLSFFVPVLFVGIAFDSGGVASGPMTATFVLAFAQGAAEAVEGANVMAEGFGVISMVSLMPILALQILGYIYKRNSVKRDLVKNG